MYLTTPCILWKLWLRAMHITGSWLGDTCCFWNTDAHATRSTRNHGYPTRWLFCSGQKTDDTHSRRRGNKCFNLSGLMDGFIALLRIGIFVGTCHSLIQIFSRPNVSSICAMVRIEQAFRTRGMGNSIMEFTEICCGCVLCGDGSVV